MLNWRNPHENHVLRALSEEGYARLQTELELVSLNAGQMALEAHIRPNWAYFPVSCVISVVGMTSDGHYTPIAEVDAAGFAGVAHMLGPRPVPYSYVALIGGDAYRIRMDRLMAEFSCRESFQTIALQYAQLLLIQIAQSAICLRRHSTEQKICKLLTQSADRTKSNQLELTHQFIGNMLGLRREDVTHVARKLQDEKLLEYTRGRITLLDRDGVAARSCECYAITKGGLVPADS